MECRPLRHACLLTPFVSPQPATMPAAPSHHSSVSRFPSTSSRDPKHFNASFHLPCQPNGRSSKSRRSAEADPTHTRGFSRRHDRRRHHLLRKPATGPDDQTPQLLHCRRKNSNAVVAENLPRLVVLHPDDDSSRERHRRSLKVIPNHPRNRIHLGNTASTTGGCSIPGHQDALSP